jgi:hypothetical protein
VNRKKTISPVKLIVGFIYKEEEALSKAKLLLKKRFSKIDFESQAIAFKHTDYYESEFGKSLKRKFVSFKKLISPQSLAKIKITTNKIEKGLSRANLRRINIDPGYLSLGKLILATTKDYKHRIYVGNGIFAEVTLFYQDSSFRPWEWTYPDYKTQDYIRLFNQIRSLYALQIKNK